MSRELATSPVRRAPVRAYVAGMTRRFTRLDLVAGVGLLVLAFGVEGVRTTHFGPKEAISIVFVLPPVLLAPFVVTGARWTAAIATALSAFYAIGAVTTAGEIDFLAHPALGVAYASIVAELGSALVVAVAGVAATVRQLGRAK